MTSPRNPFVFYLVLLIVIVIPLFSFGIANHGLWTADEPRVAEVGREMALSGNWTIPTLNRKPFLEEPPLYYAALAATFRAFGRATDKTARIPSALFAFGAVIALFFLGSLTMGPRTGFISALIMATCGEYFRVAHWVIVDSALTFFAVLSLTFFMSAYTTDTRNKRLVFYALCYISSTLAFFVKGFIGIAIPGLAVVVFLLSDKNPREILRMHLWLGALIFLAMTLPWFYSLWAQGGGDHLRVFLVHNHLERFAGGSGGHHQPFYYYLTQFPTAFLPWSLLLVPVLVRSFSRSGQPAGKAGKGTLLMKCWFVGGFLFLSLASTKRALYLMPIFAPISLLTAAYMDATLRKAPSGRLDRVFIFLFSFLPLLAGMAAIPGLVYSSGKFGFSLSFKELGWTIFFSLAAVALSAASLRNIGKDTTKFWGFSTASILSLLLLGLVVAIPVLDQFKSFVPFCEKITGSVSSAAPLIAYRPDETLRGAVPFYTGRFMEETDSLARLEEAMEKEKTIYVVIRDRREEMERELLSTGKMKVLLKQSLDTGRSLAVLTGHAAHPDGTGQ